MPIPLVVTFLGTGVGVVAPERLIGVDFCVIVTFVDATLLLDVAFYLLIETKLEFSFLL